MRARTMAGALAAATVAVAGAACAGGDDDGGDGGRGGAVEEGELATIAASLDAVPDIGTHEIVVWGDFVRAAGIAGVDRPPDPGNQPAVNEYLTTLTTGRVGADGTGPGGGPPVVLLPPTPAHVERAGRLDDFTADVGWNVLEVDRFVERQTPPDGVTVLEGDFDAGELADVLGGDGGGPWVAGDPDAGDFAVDVGDVSPARPIGETLHLSLDGDHLAVTRSVESRDATRAALAGESTETTLGEDETLVALAEALDARRPYAALLVRPGLAADVGGAVGSDRSPTPAQAEALCDAALPRMPAAVATAVADDDGPVVLVALAHDSAGDAAANADSLREIVTAGRNVASDQDWADLVTLDDVETTGDGGTVVVARLRPTEGTSPALWSQLVERRDALVSSC